jgi:putative tryptophan/tyrosine transport system substrate-binding protein
MSWKEHRTRGREVLVQRAATDAEIDEAFAAFVKAGVAALMIQNDPFFDSRRSQIVALSSHHRLPGIFHIREFPAEGGLMSYGASLADTYRQVGVYAGKILRGAKPDDLPVLRPTKFELVINMLFFSLGRLFAGTMRELGFQDCEPSGKMSP